MQIGRPSRGTRSAFFLTLSNCGKLSLFLRAELKHGVYHRKKPLSFTTGLQENEPQQDILQVLQVSHRLLALLVSFQSSYFALEKLALEVTYQRVWGHKLKTHIPIFSPGNPRLMKTKPERKRQ